jgi:HPt (histidine-containing phosphotransfer) domain-containing protein
MLDGTPDASGQAGYWLRPDAAAGCGAKAYLAERYGPVLAGLCAEELRQRHPRIVTAAAAGDLAILHWEAHALRGVAANFGLAALAELLLTLERAARQQDLGGINGPLEQMPGAVAQALVALGQDGDWRHGEQRHGE